MTTAVDEESRAEIAGALSRLLADTYTLYLKTQGDHWNVTGPMFPGLHAMFETQYIELRDAVDLIAERIRALGHPAPAGFTAYGKLSSIAEGEAGLEALDMVRDRTGCGGRRREGRRHRNCRPGDDARRGA
jgi:starvation-inducible DNA-binding protein